MLFLFLKDEFEQRLFFKSHIVKQYCKNGLMNSARSGPEFLFLLLFLKHYQKLTCRYAVPE